jgi:hypothetical protein
MRLMLPLAQTPRFILTYRFPALATHGKALTVHRMDTEASSRSGYIRNLSGLLDEQGEALLASVLITEATVGAIQILLAGRHRHALILAMRS